MRPHLFAILACALVTVSLAQSPTLDVAQVGQSLVFTLTGDVADEQWEFSYSTDGGSRWQPIEPFCLKEQENSANLFVVKWDALNCVDEFVVADALFKASTSCRNPVLYDGYSYEVVQIGEQCWFTENLRTTRYSDGTGIVAVQNDSEWKEMGVGAQCAYDLFTINVATYGRLYNWYAVANNKGLCPTGWHVPSDSDWNELEVVLQMSSDKRLEMRWRGEHGVSMWAISMGGTNRSGFSALPGGFRSYYGAFDYEGISSMFWSSTPIGTDAWYRKLSLNKDGVGRYYSDKRSGLSVRCVRS